MRFRNTIITILLLVILTADTMTARAQEHQTSANQPDNPVTLEAKIHNALSAGPASITEGATVQDHDGTILRSGNNGWTCYPDRPSSPANDPSCLDEQWAAFRQARISGEHPNITSTGIGYMLQGGAAASLTDPSVMEPPPGQQWKVGPPHVMIIMPDPEAYRGLPTRPNGGPWVMFAGTPYQHIMVPVAARLSTNH